MTAQSDLCDSIQHYWSSYDTLTVLCKKYLKQDRKAAKECGADFQLVKGILHQEGPEAAVPLAKRYFHKFSPARISVKYTVIRFHKRELCEEFYNYFYSYKDYGHAVRYLKLIERKYHNYTCANGKAMWWHDLYEKIADCYEKLGNTRQVARYKRKADQLDTKA